MRNKGFTLIELMTSLALGLVVLSIAISMWGVLSKSSQRQSKDLVMLQNKIDVSFYLRDIFNTALFYPRCIHAELLPIADKGLEVSENVIKKRGDTIKFLVLIPLEIEGRKIINDEMVQGSRENKVLVTDCHTLLYGEYQNENQVFKLSSDFIKIIEAQFNNLDDLQFYKISEESIQIDYIQGQSQLVHRFLDGSNFIRFDNVRFLKVDGSMLFTDYLLNFHLIFDGDDEELVLNIKVLNI